MINNICVNFQHIVNFKSKFVNNTQKREFTNKTDILSGSNSINARNDIAIKSATDNRAFQDFLNKKGKVTLEEYLDIKQNNPEIITKANLKYLGFENICITPFESALLIREIAKTFDDNTKIISVGNSPSFITEGLKAIGKDVTFLPISECRWFATNITDYSEYLSDYPNYKLAGEYLKHKCITPEKVKDKHIVIIDYKATGKTLDMVAKLVTEFCKIKKKRVSSKDILHDIIYRTVFDMTGDKPYKYRKGMEQIDIFDIGDKLFYSETDCASNVPHFSMIGHIEPGEESEWVTASGKSKEELFKEFDEFSRPSARAYQLCVLDELYKAKGGFDD